MLIDFYIYIYIYIERERERAFRATSPEPGQLRDAVGGSRQQDGPPDRSGTYAGTAYCATAGTDEVFSREA